MLLPSNNMANVVRPAPGGGECVICKIEDATIAVVGCGHLVACGPCAIGIQLGGNCPICRFRPNDNRPLHMITIISAREMPPPQN